MIVTIEQHNSVVNGLKTQLAIQQVLFDSLTKEVVTLKEIRLLNEEIQLKLKETIRNLTINRDELAEQLDKLRRKKGKR